MGLGARGTGGDIEEFRAIASHAARVDLRAREPDIRTLGIYKPSLPSCWRHLFVILLKKIRIQSGFTKLLEMLLGTSSTKQHTEA